MVLFVFMNENESIHYKLARYLEKQNKLTKVGIEPTPFAIPVITLTTWPIMLRVHITTIIQYIIKLNSKIRSQTKLNTCVLVGPYDFERTNEHVPRLG